MRVTAELRSALRTIGNATVGIALGLSVLWLSLVVSQFATGQGSTAGSAPPVTTASAVVAVAATATTVSSVTPTAAPTSSAVAPTDPPSTPAPTASAAPPSPPLAIAPYSNAGKRYAALRAPVGHVYLAPIAGTVLVRTYQLINGEVRVGSFVPSLPFFPYVTLESADRRVIFRPGALNTDTELLIRDGDRAELGTPLFKTVGEGASSWRAFYDRGVTANVIVSVAMLPSGAELDPVAFLRDR